MQLGTAINFCTNDWRFLNACITEARKFSDQIIISVCDHFFDGTQENYALLEAIYAAHSDCLFIEYAFNPEEPYGKFVNIYPGDPDWVHHWHNSGRLAAFYFFKEELGYLYFLDVDEIVDSEKFSAWLHSSPKGNAFRPSQYWYFREPCYQSIEQPDGQVLVRRDVLTPEMLLDPDERMGTFFRVEGEKYRHVMGLDGLPMVHHYSWVRKKGEMLKKVRAWGHHWERDWPALIEDEYAKEFKGGDFVRRYTYRKVEPRFDPFAVESYVSGPPVDLASHIERIRSLSHVQRINAKDIFKIDLIRSFLC